MAENAAWYDDVRQLWARPTEFFPSARQTDEGRLNAIVRLVVYCSVGATLASGKAVYVILGVLAVSGVSIAHQMGRRNDNTTPYAGVPPTTVQTQREKCTRPTRDNPFMNATIGSLIRDPGRPPACKYDNVAEEVWKGFDQGMFKGVEDVYDTGNNQRFYTMPVTTAAPDTIAFANYVYGNRRTCKESPELCRPR